MKPIVAIARVLLDARVGVLDSDRRWQRKVAAGLASGVRPATYFDGVMEALAYVLDMDVFQMNAPKPAGQLELPAEVQMSWIDAYDCYFVEFPPDEMQYRQEYRAEFLSPKQALELLDELRLHVLNRAHLMPAEYEEVVRRDRAERKARQTKALALASASAPEPLQLSAVRAARTSSPADVGEDGQLPEGA